MAEEKSNDNVIGLYEIVRDRYGKKHKVYSAKLQAGIQAADATR